MRWRELLPGLPGVLHSISQLLGLCVREFEILDCLVLYMHRMLEPYYVSVC